MKNLTMNGWTWGLLILVLWVTGAMVAIWWRSPTPQSDSEFDGGSHVHLDRLSGEQVQGLTLYCKVWGFLKYHHPDITKGRKLWDYEMFRFLPRVLAATNSAATREVLLKFVDAFPLQAGGTSRPDPPVDLQLAPNHNWIYDQTLLGRDLSSRLAAIYRHRHSSGKQFYVDLEPGVENPNFENELPFAHLETPDAGYRILALFRYWNIIRYWFPYRDLIGEDWDSVLAEFLPRLVAATTRDQYRLAMMALIARVRDSHANLKFASDLRPPRGSRALPVVVRFIEGVPVVAGFVYPDDRQTGLDIGDILLAIDGTPVESLVNECRPYYGASNEASFRRDIARNLTRGDESICRLRIQRAESSPREVLAHRMSLTELDQRVGMTHDMPGPAFRLLSPDVAYLKLSAVKSEKIASYLRAARSTQGLVIDIRNYPAEFVVFSLGSHLVAETTPFARFSQGDLGNPGAFHWSEAISLVPKSPPYTGKIVILVDEQTQSQAEYTALAFRAAPGALIIGSTTAGADGNYSVIPLPGGLTTGISGIGVFWPDKRQTQRVGIRPDLEVHPTIAGVRAGRDEVLEAALRHILSNAVSNKEILRLSSPSNTSAREL